MSFHCDLYLLASSMAPKWLDPRICVAIDFFLGIASFIFQVIVTIILQAKPIICTVSIVLVFRLHFSQHTFYAQPMIKWEQEYGLGLFSLPRPLLLGRWMGNLIDSKHTKYKAHHANV